tara:strand:- start:7732 stop:8025 length:294 start_codon:yes stop_codon:yes gene_type:complete
MWVVFEDSIADQHVYPIKNINAIFVTSTTNITVYIRNPLQPTESVSDDTITLTCTADKTDEVLTLLLHQLTHDTQRIIRINSAIYKDITTVAYTAGA